jgi:hypothetical protein
MSLAPALAPEAGDVRDLLRVVERPGGSLAA